MSVNKKIPAPMKKAAAYIISVLCGLSVTAALTAALSGGMFILGLPPDIAGALAFIAYIAGCFTAGLVCGCIKERAGLKTGLICGVSVFSVFAVFSLVSGNFTGDLIIVKVILAVAAACTGAVIGVNRVYSSKNGTR